MVESECRVQRHGGRFCVQVVVEVGWRRLLRAVGLRFVRPRYDWRTVRYDSDCVFLCYPGADGGVVWFDTFDKAQASVDRFHRTLRGKALEADLP